MLRESARMVWRDCVESIFRRGLLLINSVRRSAGEDDAACYPAVLTDSNTRFAGRVEKKARSGVIS